jgi:hypothetical protein
MALTDGQVAALAAGEWDTNESDADVQFRDFNLRDDEIEREYGSTHGGCPSLVGITIALAKEVRELRTAFVDSNLGRYGLR